MFSRRLSPNLVDNPRRGDSSRVDLGHTASIVAQRALVWETGCDPKPRNRTTLPTLQRYIRAQIISRRPKNVPPTQKNRGTKENQSNRLCTRHRSKHDDHARMTKSVRQFEERHGRNTRRRALATPGYAAKGRRCLSQNLAPRLPRSETPYLREHRELGPIPVLRVRLDDVGRQDDLPPNVVV